MEAPECPVCLQVYDGATAVPRVLGCGHSACESCLLQLPRPFLHTLRCPSCTQLVSYPHLHGGAAALPKNIDLLRISLAAISDATHNPNPTDSSTERRRLSVTPQPHYFVPSSWSNDSYSVWKDWVLPTDAVTLAADDPEPQEEVGFLSVLRGTVVSSCSSPSSPCFCFRCCVKGDGSVSLVRVGESRSCLDNNVFVYGHTVRIVECLAKMVEGERAELGLILKASLRQLRLCKSYGFWYNSEDSCVYLVCERHDGGLLNKFAELETGACVDGDGLIGEVDLEIEDGLLIFVKVGMEICEALISLHSEGLIAGCLGLSCFQSDNFARSYIDLNAVLITGRGVHKCVVKIVSGLRRKVDSTEMGAYLSELLESHVFLSPEVLFELLQKEGIVSQLGSLIHSVGYGSDSWSLSCLLLSVLIGKHFTELLVSYMCAFVHSRENSDLDCLCWMEKVASLLESKIGSKYVGLQQILCNCLHFDPKVRPLVTDIWKCFRGLIIKPQYDHFVGFEGAVEGKKTGCCMVLGDVCKLPKKSIKGVETHGKDENGGAKVEQVREMNAEKDLFEDLSTSKLKVTELQGHLDCITALAVGGGFLFSSSFDKTIHVWSLQDFTLVHSFRGHEHRVMALVFVDEEQPFCISGDNGGGIFLWGITVPLRQEPLKNWHEQKDWRFSGIHALTVTGSQYLYTGSGDKLIKAWSLRDYTLSCTLSGHKSVVSALAVCEGVLYSGSWDGTIRLWSLNDHTPLTVLGEDAPGNVIPVLSLAADQHMLVAVHENGSIKIWKDDVAMRSRKVHDGAIFAVGMEGKWLFTGGLDKTLCVQELSADEYQIDALPFGYITCDSVITALSYWKGQLFIGFGDKLIKVYSYGK